MAVLDAYEEEHLERLLRVGTCLAMCGYGAQVGALAATARAFRTDAQLWGAHARFRGPMGRTALMHTAYEGDLPRIWFLLERGADVEAMEAEFGDTALMLACSAGQSETVRLLVERGGANVNAARTTDGPTALMSASQKGNLEIVRFLVERGGATVNAARTTDGTTALMWASMKGHPEIVRFLVERGGANVNAAKTTDGATALMRASQKGNIETAFILVELGA
jgi:ankyrin repeat protein